MKLISGTLLLLWFSLMIYFGLKYQCLGPYQEFVTSPPSWLLEKQKIWFCLLR